MNDITGSPRSRSAVQAAVAGLGMLAIVATLSGCSAVSDLVAGAEKEPQRHYATYDDAPSSPKSTDAAWFMPAWVPADATDIDVRLNTSERGYVIAFDSEQGVDTAACTPVDGSLGGPAMTADFLPAKLPTRGLVTCGDGRVTTEIGDRWYGWTTEDVLPAATDSASPTPAAR